MPSDLIRRLKSEIARAAHASSETLAQIEEELQREPSAELWILHGDAIQVSDGDEYDPEDAEHSYRMALELDPESADAYESLGHLTFSAHDDAAASLEYFRKAIALGAGDSAREGLKEAEEEIQSGE